MTSIKTTQTLVLDRYSRILVPLPPVQSIKDEVGKLVEDEFKVTPEYVETDWCEGYAISWRSWYGFGDCLRYLSMRSFFPLRLKRIIDDSTSNRGLDLAVIDAQTGQERSVGSLSGGESFMCALSLAIGMSEGISSMNGGIKLENIFIDEGFGSLDNESLDNALEALMVLASNGRMIGIISHVSEIKNRIPNVIEVIKTNNGSKIIS